MRIGKLLPFFGRAMPGKRAREGMALGTGLAETLTRDAGFLMDAPLGFVHHRRSFLGREPMRITEILYD